jgi:hypothetical protein
MLTMQLPPYPLLRLLSVAVSLPYQMTGICWEAETDDFAGGNAGEGRTFGTGG